MPGDEDEGAYWTVLTDPAKASGHTAVGNAYRFFLKRIGDLHEAGELQVERLATTIGDRLSLVFVTVSEGERPHKIFESINATGVGLSQSDLLRNYLFMALGERSNSVYAQHWRPLERAIGTDGLEGLVRDDLQSTGEFVRQDQVYRTARAQLEPLANDLDVLEAHVVRLARRGAYYALFLQPADPNDTAAALGVGRKALRHLAFLRAWGAGTTYPLLLHVYAEVDAGQATHEQAESCLEAIESFIVRRYLTAVPTNVLNRLFIQLISALPAGEPIDAALRRELSRDGRWPDDEQVGDGIASLPYYAHGRAHQQRLVLQRLESRLRAEVDVDFDSADLSIEHIMPQTLSAEWKAELSTDGQDAQEIFDRLGHTLGNLTLTAWNSKLSNQLFERKQEILSDSELKLNEPLAGATSWGVDEIEARGRALAESATALWSAPIPGVVTPHAGFDWGQVDQAVNSLPAGSWTSYGDLAELAGTAAQPTANHVAKDPGDQVRVSGARRRRVGELQLPVARRVRHARSDRGADRRGHRIRRAWPCQPDATPRTRRARGVARGRADKRLTISRGLAAVETARITGSLAGEQERFFNRRPARTRVADGTSAWPSGTRRMSIRLARGPYPTSLAGALGRFGSRRAASIARQRLAAEGRAA